MICCNQKAQNVTNEIVMLAANDLSLIQEAKKMTNNQCYSYGIMAIKNLK